MRGVGVVLTPGFLAGLFNERVQLVLAHPAVGKLPTHWLERRGEGPRPSGLSIDGAVNVNRDVLARGGGTLQERLLFLGR